MDLLSFGQVAKIMGWKELDSYQHSKIKCQKAIRVLHI